MKPESTIQEILLITTTTFSKRQLCETDTKEKTRMLSHTQQLETACWNGMMDELLPEIMHPLAANKKLFLWKVDTRKFSLSIIKADRPPVQDGWYALDPHLFLCQQDMN